MKHPGAISLWVYHPNGRARIKTADIRIRSYLKMSMLSFFNLSAPVDIEAKRSNAVFGMMLHPYHSITISVLDINCGNCRVNSKDMLVISYYLIYVILRGIDYSYNHYHILAIFLSNG